MDSEDESGWITCQRPVIDAMHEPVSKEEYLRLLEQSVGKEEATRMYTSAATPNT